MMESYLGDGVYVSTDGYHIILTVKGGIEPVEKQIFLDDMVVVGLLRYIKDLSGQEDSINEMSKGDGNGEDQI